MQFLPRHLQQRGRSDGQRGSAAGHRLPTPCPRRPGPTGPATPPGHPGRNADPPALPLPRPEPVPGFHLRAPRHKDAGAAVPPPPALANPRRYRSAAAGDQCGAAAPATPILRRPHRRSRGSAQGARRPPPRQRGRRGQGGGAARAPGRHPPHHLGTCRAGRCGPTAPGLPHPGDPALPRGLARRYRPAGTRYLAGLLQRPTRSPFAGGGCDPPGTAAAAPAPTPPRWVAARPRRRENNPCGAAVPRSVSPSARPSCCGRCVCACVCARRAERRQGGRRGGRDAGAGRGGASACAGAGRGSRGAERGRPGLCVCLCVPGMMSASSPVRLGRLCVRVPASVRVRVSPGEQRRGESPSSPREEFSYAPVCLHSPSAQGFVRISSLSRRPAEPSDFTSSSSFLELCFIIISQLLHGHPGALLVPGREQGNDV